MWRRIALLCLFALSALPAVAGVAPETTGHIEKLPAPAAHWAWVTDVVLERAALVDMDASRILGIVNGGYGTLLPLFPSRRAEIYMPSTYYSRRTHGERTDVLEIYDAETLSEITEIVVPPKRATNAVALAHASLSDDDRFVVLFNWTTGTSLSVVDVENRRFVGEIDTPGCSLAYAAGPRRFFSLCGDGSIFILTLNDDGTEASRSRSAPFFSPQDDPITEKAVRVGDQWLFVSFDGVMHSIDVSGPEIRINEPWSLLSDAERNATWRIGGLQHLAAHSRRGLLYVLMHQGKPDTHKEPGTHVWIYDIAARRRVQQIKLVTPGVSIYGFPIEFGKNSIWPFNRMADWLLDAAVPAAITAIQVTQDERPLLLTASQFSGAVGVYDALTGTFLRRVLPTGWTTDLLLAPALRRNPGATP